MVSRLQHLQKEAIIGLFGITTGREVFIFFLSCIFITLVAYSSWMAIVCDKLIDLGDENEESCLNPTPIDLRQRGLCVVQGCSKNPNAGSPIMGNRLNLLINSYPFLNPLNAGASLPLPSPKINADSSTGLYIHA